MIPAGSGRIVLLASQAALVSLPSQSAYTASKGAVAALTRSLAIDWAQHGITVNAICPTFVWTPMAAPMLEIEAVHSAAVRAHPARPRGPAARHRRRGGVPVLAGRVARHGRRAARRRRLDGRRAGAAALGAPVLKWGQAPFERHDQRSGRAVEMRIDTAFALVYSSIVSAHSSRPYPLALTPPSGCPGTTSNHVLTQTVPASSC